MSREIKLGIFAIITLAAFIWGFQFIKGKNLLSKTYTYKTVLRDVSQLDVSSPVLLNGLKIGSVTKISLNKKNLKEMIVEFTIEGDYSIPTDAEALIISPSVMGGKAISMDFDHLCVGEEDCAQSGHVFNGRSVGILGSMLGNEDVDSYIDSLSVEVNKIVEGIGSEDGKGALNATVRELEVAVKNISEMTRATNNLIATSHVGINKTVNNLSQITANLAANDRQISGVLSNLDSVTYSLKNADIGNTLTRTTTNLDSAISQLNVTLQSTDKTMQHLSSIMEKADDGEGSLSKLLNDRALYTNLETTSKNLSLLLQDIRLNPKRYVNVSVFGRKGKEYELPEDDPAFQGENDEN